jgi:hypothetical protein
MNLKKFFGKWSCYIIIGTIILITLTILLVVHFRKEKFGYSQNIDRNYTDLTFEDRERHSIELPGQFETASDMPEATASYTNPDLSFL